MAQKSYLPALVIAILCVIWGSTWIAIKFGLEDLPPFLFAGMRFTLATALLVVFMKIQRIRFPADRRTWKIMLVLGVFQAIDYAAVFWAEQYIDSAVAAILFATMPFFVAMFSYFMLDDHRITWTQLTGITVSFIGVFFIFLRDVGHSRNSVAGDLVILVGSMSGAFISVYAKKHANDIHPVTNTTVQLGFAAASLTLIGLLAEDFRAFHVTPESLGAIVYLAMVGSAVAFVLYMWVIKKTTVMQASVITLCTPIVAILLGWFWRDEDLGGNVLIGTVLILTGVYVVNILDFKIWTHKTRDIVIAKPAEKVLCEEEMHA